MSSLAELPQQANTAILDPTEVDPKYMSMQRTASLANIASLILTASIVAQGPPSTARVLPYPIDLPTGFEAAIANNEKYGTDRVFNTPLSEQGIAGFSAQERGIAGSSAQARRRVYDDGG